MHLRYPLVLGSASPRRKELLSSTGIPFTVDARDVDESFDPSDTPEVVAVKIAEKKLEAYTKSDSTVLCADTIVTINGTILGKPTNQDDAFQMLSALNGQTHRVITGVALKSPEHTQSFYVETQVTFYTLEEEEILQYISSRAPYDKAGAYGIQDWIGVIGIQSIVGDYNNVVGLPVSKVYQVLKDQF